MRRKLLLKGSQITSLQQREITMQKKLYNTLKNVYSQISIHFTQNLSTSSISNSNQSIINSFSTKNINTNEIIPTLPELLNITNCCFEDIIIWQNNLNLQRNYEKIEFHHQNENNNEESRGVGELKKNGRVGGNNNNNNNSNNMSFGGGYEEWLRKKPPTIPKR